jgi:hypothetical protein
MKNVKRMPRGMLMQCGCEPGTCSLRSWYLLLSLAEFLTGVLNYAAHYVGQITGAIFCNASFI